MISRKSDNFVSGKFQKKFQKNFKKNFKKSFKKISRKISKKVYKKISRKISKKVSKKFQEKFQKKFAIIFLNILAYPGYAIFTTQVSTFDEAAYKCKSNYGSNMVMIKTESEQNQWNSFLKTIGEFGGVWLGLSDHDSPGTMAWNDADYVRRSLKSIAVRRGSALRISSTFSGLLSNLYCNLTCSAILYLERCTSTNAIIRSFQKNIQLSKSRRSKYSFRP